MGLLAAVVVMFYVTGEASREYYSRPELLWLVGPLLAVWVGRMWWLAHRGRMHSDPVLFAVRDWPSYVIGGLIVVVGVAADASWAQPTRRPPMQFLPISRV